MCGYRANKTEQKFVTAQFSVEVAIEKVGNKKVSSK